MYIKQGYTVLIRPSLRVTRHRHPRREESRGTSHLPKHFEECDIYFYLTKNGLNLLELWLRYDTVTIHPFFPVSSLKSRSKNIAIYLMFIEVPPEYPTCRSVMAGINHSEIPHCLYSALLPHPDMSILIFLSFELPTQFDFLHWNIPALFTFSTCYTRSRWWLSGSGRLRGHHRERV